MIILETEYPCPQCGKEIDPNDRHCKYCGKKQPDVETRLHYNIFALRDGGVYTMRYGADILTIEDARQLASLSWADGYQHDCFVGAYYPNMQTERLQLHVTEWRPMVENGLGHDLGQRTIGLSPWG